LKILNFLWENCCFNLFCIRLGKFFWKKKLNSKNYLVFSQKRCEYSWETTFVLRLFKILSAILRALASIIGKKTEKINFFQFFWGFFKSLSLRIKFWACLTRLIKLHKKKLLCPKNAYILVISWANSPLDHNKNYFFLM
jgi:hypothetical protein